MARPLKHGVDYFPLDVKMDDEIELIESEHKITGFAVLIKLYQRIYASNYWLKWDKKEVFVFSNRVNVDKNEVIAIINSCLEWDVFSKKLFDEYSILTSSGIQKRFFEISKRRTKLYIVEDFLLVNVPDREKQTKVFVDINSVIVGKSTQRKGKESKSKNKEIYKPENVTDQTWDDFLLHRKKKKATVTQTVINGFIKQADLAKWTLEDALKETIERGWVGFKAEWVDKKTESKSNYQDL
jgi:hypothetical protein